MYVCMYVCMHVCMYVCMYVPMKQKKRKYRIERKFQVQKTKIIQ